MSDETTEVRTHGMRGLKRHVPVDATVSATGPVDLTGPADYDATQGHKHYAMQGNDTLPNCFFAAAVHSRTTQAVESVDGNATVFVKGFEIDPTDAGAALYEEYVASQGETMPGSGTDPYSGTTFLLGKGYWKYAGVLGPTSRTAKDEPYFEPLTVKEAIFDFQGGAILLLALDPDAEQEFEDDEPWGTQSSTPDDNDGHAVSGVKYQQGNPITTCITWAALEGMLEEFDINCIEGLVLTISDAFILKNGQAAADALVAKWGLQTSPTLAASEADSTPPTPEDVPRTPVTPKGPEDLLARARGIEADLRHLVEMAIKRIPEQEIFAAMEKMIEFYLQNP